MLSDLRESGAIEQDADTILFVYRASVYKPDEKSLEGTAEVIVGKQRGGPTGRIELAFDKTTTTFRNIFR